MIRINLLPPQSIWRLCPHCLPVWLHFLYHHETQTCYWCPLCGEEWEWKQRFVF